ncbi:hypothetical protein ANO11243_045370 [Dothideomycetidae sp. 11243]|nr:hypothetical protein ANO11243_045370 [fungal sp. No.11243]
MNGISSANGVSNGAVKASRKRDSGARPPLSVYTASSVAEIQQALQDLSRHEKAVTSKLDSLVASQKDLSQQLARLDIARAQLGPQVSAVRSVSNDMLSSAAKTADRISGAVKRLDNEQAAVKATLDVVEQVVELKACVLGVHGAMEGTQDWELAATYLNRASKVPAEVIDGAFAEEIVPTADVPDAPRITLDKAAQNLCALFLREFEKAIKEGDGTNVTRFFKLFPLIGRESVGLDAYGRYVCGGVSSRARGNLSTNTKKEGMFYALNLTKLFEHIAQIVDGHEPLVTRHYGRGAMSTVIEKLQVEADLQGGIILDTWSDECQVSRKLTDVKSYAFNFLVQSFLPAQKTANFRTGSPMLRNEQSPRASEDESVDMKQVDALLNEMAVMLGRWALYSNFIAGKVEDTSDSSTPKALTVPRLISNSSLQRKISDYLVDPFSIMTTFFFRRSVEKAFQMDESPADLSLSLNKKLGSSPPYITSAVDDVMYILNQVLQRSMGTSQRSVVGNVVPSISRVLSSDFYGMIQRKMRDESYPKAAVQGALPPENLVVSFIVMMNNLDVSTDYVRRIVEGQLNQREANMDDNGGARPRLAHLFPFGNDAIVVENQVRSILTSFENKTSELLAEAVEVLSRQVLRPRLRPVLLETFRDVDYAPEEDAQEDEGDTEPVAQRFERGWTSFVSPIKRITTEHNFERIHHAIVEYFAKILEKRVWSLYGRVNAIGAIHLERDVTAIVNAAAKGGKYGLRDAFVRTSQMLLILNMDDDEWEHHRTVEQSDSDIDWVLDASERLRTREILAPPPA